MCISFRRPKQVDKWDDESTIANFPVKPRKLTIDRCRVVAAPPTPRTFSFGRSPRLPASVSSKRESLAMSESDPRVSFAYTSPRTTISVPGSPLSQSIMAYQEKPEPSPRSGTSKSAAASQCGKDDKELLFPGMDLMAESAWLGVTTTVTSLEAPDGVSDSERVFQEKRAARRARRPSSETADSVRAPEPAALSGKVSMQSLLRKASLDAISLAAATITEELKGDSPRYSKQNRAPAPAASEHGSVPSNASRSPSLSARHERVRKSRPPPIAITSSRAPPRIPTAYLKDTNSISTVRLALPLNTAKALPTPPTTPSFFMAGSKSVRQSICSVTSSQYSPTFSILPANQIQIVQPRQANKVLAHNATVPAIPASVKVKQSETMMTPPTTASLQPLVPPDYTVAQSAKQPGSIAARVMPETPESLISAALQKQGFFPLNATNVSASSERTTGEKNTRPVPLTSASLSFPPNLPDFTYTHSINGSPPRKLRQSNAPALHSVDK